MVAMPSLALIPDPTQVIPPAFFEAPSSPGTRRRGGLAQRTRRARVLAATRTLVAAGGLGEVTIARVSDLSDISKQTIYNLVGNKVELVKASLNEYIAALSVRAESIAGYPSPLFALADLYWIASTTFSDYIRNASLICSGSSPELNLNAREHQAKVFKAMCLHNGHRASNYDISTLCFQASTLTSVATIDWASGALSTDELRRQLAACQMLITLGAPCGSRKDYTAPAHN